MKENGSFKTYDNKNGLLDDFTHNEHPHKLWGFKVENEIDRFRLACEKSAYYLFVTSESATVIQNGNKVFLKENQYCSRRRKWYEYHPGTFFMSRITD